MSFETLTNSRTVVGDGVSAAIGETLDGLRIRLRFSKSLLGKMPKTRNVDVAVGRDSDNGKVLITFKETGAFRLRKGSILLLPLFDCAPDGYSCPACACQLEIKSCGILLGLPLAEWKRGIEYAMRKVD